jgi:hypothetical protein
MRWSIFPYPIATVLNAGIPQSSIPGLGRSTVAAWNPSAKNLLAVDDSNNGPAAELLQAFFGNKWPIAAK